MSTTISQQASRFALDQLEHANVDKEFAVLTAGLPAMILQNGFGQALAFLCAKGTDKNGNFSRNDKHLTAFRIIAAWLKKRNVVQDDEPKKLLDQLSKMPQWNYLRAHEEFLAVLEWVKRYANSALFLSDNGGGE